jgi:hypothetical protein
LKREKLFRITASIMLAFGWLFMSPAYSDDPLSLAAQEIQELNNSIDDLGYQDEFISLIEEAEDKYDIAVSAKESQTQTSDLYDDSLDAETTALEEKDLAQSVVDGQTATVATALEHKDDAYDALGVANINLQTAQQALNSAGGAGLQYDVYSLIRVDGLAATDQLLCSGTLNSSSMQRPVCGNRYENFIVKFTGKITVPSWFTQTYFAGYTDDGFRMYIDGALVINNWVEQGTTWSAYSPVYDVTSDKVFDVEIWWYNGGGPGSYHLGWAIPGGWTGAGCDYAGNPRVWGQNFSCNLNTFSSGSGATQEQTNDYNNALSARNSAQDVYNDKLNVYNQSVSTLNTYNQTLTTKTNNYNTAISNVATALQNKEDAEDEYEQSIVDVNNAIQNAWDYYYEQTERELNAAIAQAAANAANNQPTPEPSPEPTPEPTEEPTDEPTAEPTDEPSPEPSPDPTEEPTNEPTPDPTPEPSPEPTVDPTEEPTPEPTPEVTPDPEPTDEPVVDPTEEPTPEPSPEPGPDPEPEENPWTEPDVEITDEVLAALVPEKGTGTEEDLSNVIANLTSSDNKLVTLSPEQVTAVSQTLRALTQEAKQEVAEDLGIKPSEVAQIAEQMKSNPALAEAFVEFTDRADTAGETPMPFTLADAVTEVQTEAFLADPLGAVFAVDPVELLSNFSELGMDMTDDQREKAQEVIVPVVIASQIAGAMIRRNK